MLEVQKYLAGKSLADLSRELGISVYRHPTLPLVGLKYSSIDSPKVHPVVRECRGIVLDESDGFALAAKGFSRFFNAGEVAEEFREFNWSNFSCTEKVDGSLILLFFYQGGWRVNTSGSFGLREVYGSGKTWEGLFWEVAALEAGGLRAGLTYVFELCTPYNKVVRRYERPTVFLLSVFDGLREFSPRDADIEAATIGSPRPETYDFESREEIAAFLLEKEGSDMTFEGVVVRDDKDLRFKVKTKTYCALHHLKDNGNIFNPKRLVPLVLAGEVDEVVAYLPEVREAAEGVKKTLEEHWDGLLTAWRRYAKIGGQKDFAMSVRGEPFYDILFDMRKRYGDGQTVELLREVWRSDPDRISKRLYR